MTAQPESGAAVTRVAAVRVPERSFASDLRAIRVVWHRELLRFFHDRPRLVASLLQPMLYLFVLGSGLSSMTTGGPGGDLRTFLFPGVMSMAVLFTCFFAAGSLVWDREFGFMREMMVAPVRRGAILIGKCLGGATAGTFQGLVMLSVAGLVGVPYSFSLVGELLAEVVLLSFALTAIGVALAARIKSMQSFMAIMQVVLMPLFFMSGALFPLRALPTWLMVLTRLDPLTYAVDPMRRAVLEHVSPGASMGLGVTWGSYTVPTGLELALVSGFAMLALSAASAQFARVE
jgi:ABC-2 type transport system permease protein